MSNDRISRIEEENTGRRRLMLVDKRGSMFTGWVCTDVSPKGRYCKLVETTERGEVNISDPRWGSFTNYNPCVYIDL